MLIAYSIDTLLDSSNALVFTNAPVIFLIIFLSMRSTRAQSMNDEW